jgi:hypothetical protein
VFSFDVAIFQKEVLKSREYGEFEIIDRGSSYIIKSMKNAGPLRVACQWEVLKKN